MEHRGAYAGIADTMEKLRAWAEERGVVESGPPFALYFDNPLETPEEELRSEACIQVSPSLSTSGDITVKTLEATDVAETKHSGRPEEFYKTYGPFLEGLLGSGYRLEGPAREFYHNPGEVKGPGYGFLIQQPISKGD